LGGLLGQVEVLDVSRTNLNDHAPSLWLAPDATDGHVIGRGLNTGEDVRAIGVAERAALYSGFWISNRHLSVTEGRATARDRTTERPGGRLCHSAARGHRDERDSD
jgi:hypothetical protein